MFFFFLVVFMIQWQFASHLLVAGFYSQETKEKLPAAKAFSRPLLRCTTPQIKFVFSFAVTFYPTLHANLLCLPFYYFLATFNALEASDLAKQSRRTREKGGNSMTTTFWTKHGVIKGLHVQGFKTLPLLYFSVAK